MFTWICPKCGAEIPPSLSECPNCTGQTASPPGEASPALSQPPPSPPAPAVQAATAARPHPPMWLMAAASALVFVLLAAGAYFAYRHFRGEPAVTTPLRQPAAAAPVPASASATPGMKALLDAVEVTGIRMRQDRAKKAEVIFIVVNHSPAPLTDLSGTVTLRPSTSQPGKEIVGIFGFRNLSLGPFESRELRAPLNTSLRMYELPDWQFLKTELNLSMPSLKE